MKNKIQHFASALALGLFIFIAFGSVDDEKNDNNSTTNSSEQNSTSSEDTDNQKEWTELVQFKGNGNKKSDVFTYSGGKARMRYNFKAGDMGMFATYVVKEGQDIMREGGFPEVMIQAGEEGESNLSHLNKGNYYLNVSSANGNWVVIIEELK